jgi:hypothetical protein
MAPVRDCDIAATPRGTRTNTRRRGCREVIAAAAILFVATSCGSTRTPTPSATATLPSGFRTWLMTSQALSEMSGVGDAAAALGGSTLLEIVGQAETTFSTVPATSVRSFRSIAALMQWLSSTSAPGQVKAVLYDPEFWPFTPAVEQQNPRDYARQFVQAARQHALIPILAPGMDLSKVLAPAASSDASGYLQVQLPEEMAQALAGGVGYVVIQSQSLERSPAEYLSVVQAGVAQIASPGSQIQVLAGLSTNPPGGPVTAGELLSDMHLTRGLVAGYWLNVPVAGASCPGCGPTNPGLGLQILASVS